MKLLLLIVTVILLSSCDVMDAEKDYNTRSWELKKKTAELDYLERLYKLKGHIKYDEKMRVMDSLIQSTK
jgi:hypothetical protein